MIFSVFLLEKQILFFKTNFHNFSLDFETKKQLLEAAKSFVVLVQTSRKMTANLTKQKKLFISPAQAAEKKG